MYAHKEGMIVYIAFKKDSSPIEVTRQLKLVSECMVMLQHCCGNLEVYRCKPEFSAQCMCGCECVCVCGCGCGWRWVGVQVWVWVCVCVGVGVHVSSFLLLYRMCITHFKGTVFTEASSHV